MYVRFMRDKEKIPLEIKKGDFKKIGYKLINTIADFFDTIEDYSVTPGESALELQKAIGNSSLPEQGISAEEIISKL